MKIGLIGALGWIGSALGRALLDRGLVPADHLTVLIRRGAQPDYLGQAAVHWAADVAELVERSDIVIVAVRPQDWPALRLQAPGRLVISVMAMVPLAELAGSGGRIVRAMPNALAEERRSYSPWFAGPGVTAADKDIVARILGCIGDSDEMTCEAHLDVMAVLPGSGPAYPALMATALLDFARAQGLPEAVARRAVEAIVCDGGAMLKGRIETAPDLLATFRDYAGITAAGLNRADEDGFSGALQSGLAAALARGRLPPG
ncbi:MAG: pyrroline-5-carboxylate reductase family protein [Paenirhodobacter sp.]|uniref:pyrroline-5-carboxylate reductase family protein n=1 Tax=Paenirhodobacter sp. TaxID=1965326 RepID=UPI003D0DC3E0